MKKLQGIFLLACLSIPVLGTYSWLYFQKLRVKQEVKQAIMGGMHKERLVRLAFTQGQSDTLLRWEHAREFEFQDQMYDVVERQSLGDSIVYWCWWDIAETLLNRQLETLVTNAFAQDPQSQEAQDKLFHFLDILFYQAQSALSLFKPSFVDLLSESLPGKVYTMYHSWKQRPPSPPPKLV